MTRTDHDAPSGEQVYVIRIEAASGHRVKTTVVEIEIESLHAGHTKWDLLRKKAEILVGLCEDAWLA